MAGRINKNLNNNAVAGLLNKKGFLNLDKDVQSAIVDSVAAGNETDKNGGRMGKFLGANPANASIHIAFLLCTMLVLVLVFDCIFSYSHGKSINMDLVNIITPVVTSALGFVFGRGTKG